MTGKSVFLMLSRLTQWCFFLILLVVISTSCKEDPLFEGSDTWSDSDNTQKFNLTGETIVLDPLIQIVKFNLYDSLAFIVGKVIDNECLIHVYKLADGKRILSFGAPGRGPNEFIGLPLEMQIIREKGELLVTDRNGRQTQIFSITDLLDSAGFSPKRIIPLTFTTGPVISIIDDQRFLCHEPLGGKMFKTSEPPEMLMLHNITDMEKTASVRYPPKSYVGDCLVYNSHFSFPYTHRVVISPDGRKILVAYYFMDILEIYDNDLNLVKRLHGPDQFLPAFESRGDGLNIVQRENSREAFEQPIAGDDEFWVHYSGAQTNARTSSHTRIYAFNWQGELLRSYQPDSLVLLLDIDFTRKAAYGLVKYGELKRFYY